MLPPWIIGRKNRVDRKRCRQRRNPPDQLNHSRIKLWKRRTNRETGKWRIPNQNPLGEIFRSRNWNSNGEEAMERKGSDAVFLEFSLVSFHFLPWQADFRGKYQKNPKLSRFGNLVTKFRKNLQQLNLCSSKQCVWFRLELIQIRSINLVFFFRYKRPYANI